MGAVPGALDTPPLTRTIVRNFVTLAIFVSCPVDGSFFMAVLLVIMVLKLFQTF